MKNLVFLLIVMMLSTALSAQQKKSNPNQLNTALKQLSLTEDQQNQIDQIQLKYKNEATPLKKATPLKSATPENQKIEMQKMMASRVETRKQKMGEIRKVLTEEQRVQLRKILGAKKIETTG